MTVELILGDCVEALKKLKDSSVDAVVTDPPYGIGFVYKQGREVAADPESYSSFLLPIIQECRRIAKPGAFFAIWQAQLNYRHFWNWFGDDIRIFIAAKNFVQLRKTPINCGYDPVVCWYQPGTPLRPTKQQRSVDFHVANTAGVISDMSRIEKGHPCPRPLDTVMNITDNFTLPGGVVLDPFMGSGTTGVACKRTERSFIGIEIDPNYFGIAKKRIEGGETRKAKRMGLFP